MCSSSVLFLVITTLWLCGCGSAAARVWEVGGFYPPLPAKMCDYFFEQASSVVHLILSLTVQCGLIPSIRGLDKILSKTVTPEIFDGE